MKPSPKQTWQATRARYTWHLRAPFKDKFDSSHWWEGQATVDPIAAVYELARRHPHIGAAQLQPSADPDRAPDPIRCLCTIGFKSWASLTGREKDYWCCTAGNLKGVDCRYDVEQCYSINESVFIDMFAKPALERALEKNHATEEPLSAGAKELVKILDDPSEPEKADAVKAAVAREAIYAHRKGYLLIAVSPDLAQDKAEELMAKQYRNYLELRRALGRKAKQRARCENWLELISSFEQAEMELKKKRDQVFARYKRAIDGIHFQPRPLPV